MACSQLLILIHYMHCEPCSCITWHVLRTSRLKAKLLYSYGNRKQFVYNFNFVLVFKKNSFYVFAYTQLFPKYIKKRIKRKIIMYKSSLVFAHSHLSLLHILHKSLSLRWVFVLKYEGCSKVHNFSLFSFIF